MRKAAKNEPVPPWDSEVRLLAWLATCVSVLSLLFYFQRGEIMLYGDAVAHMNIARRVFDSKTPGLLQLGTVWLPLPHLLMMPFLISMNMWRTGVGGSIPSMAAYVLGVVGIFRLTRGALSRVPPDGTARGAAWIAALVYAANPNLIYMQTTAMGEAVYLAFFIWAVVYFGEAIRGDPKALTKCALCLAATCLTRYDGWFLATTMAGIVLLVAIFRRNGLSHKAAIRSRANITKFVLIIAAAPALWLAYNGIVYRNPLEFENGPYSAKAIERKTQSTSNPGHPGSGNAAVAASYFLKAAEGNVASAEWLQRFWVATIFAALLITASLIRRDPSQASVLTWLLLLVPVPFYELSIAYGGVPVFVPQWWPFSHYNVRYGLQLLPAFAVSVGMLAWFALRRTWSRRLRVATGMALALFTIGSYASIWYAGPTCLEEAQINMRTRTELEAQLSTWIEKLPANSTLLMYLGDHVGAVQRAGMPLKRTINEGNHRVWMQPADPDGLWERALANPAQYADYVLAFEGDPVWQAVHEKHLRELVEIHITGQARAILYRVR